LEVGPFPLYGDNEYRFDLSKLKMDRRWEVMIYYSFAFPNEDSESHKALLEANNLELDIWNGEILVYSFRGCVPFGEYGGKKLPNGKYKFRVPKEKLIKGDYCLSKNEINKKCKGRLRIHSRTPSDSRDAKATVTFCLEELTSK